MQNCGFNLIEATFVVALLSLNENEQNGVKNIKHAQEK